MKKLITKTATFLMTLALAFTIMPVEAQAATKVKLNKNQITIYSGGTATLKVSGTNRKITFKTSNKSVAVVSNKGKITAKKAGKATITVTIGKTIKKCKVIVKKENLKLNKSNITLSVGSTTSLKTTGTSRKVNFKSSNKSVATITSSGKITAKKAGTAIITAKVGKTTKKCKVTVKAKEQSKTSVSIYWNGEKTIKATGAVGTVKWESSNKSIATVKGAGKNAAIITGKKVGKATITAKVNGKTFKKYTVNVKMKTTPLTKKEKELAFYMQGKYDDCIMFNTLSSDADLKYFGLTTEFDNRNLWITHKKALQTMRKYLPGRAVYICDVNSLNAYWTKQAELKAKGVRYYGLNAISHNHGKTEKWSVMWIE